MNYADHQVTGDPPTAERDANIARRLIQVFIQQRRTLTGSQQSRRVLTAVAQYGLLGSGLSAAGYLACRQVAN